MLTTIKFQLPAIAWSILVLILCNLPMSQDNQLPVFEGFDKMVHLGFFFILTVLLLFGKINQQNSYHYRPLTIVKIIIITAALGGGVELLQWKVFTYRSAEWWDFISDMLGVGAGIFSYLLLHRKSRIIEKA